LAHASTAICVAKCQGAQRSYWHIRKVKVKLQIKMSKIALYTIEKTIFKNVLIKLLKSLRLIHFLKSLRDLKSAAVALIAFHGFMMRSAKK
jgi:hypothetical protein